MKEEVGILEDIRKELNLSADKKTKISAQKFFKEKINCYGVKTPIVRKVAKKYFKKVKGLNKKDIFNLSEELLKNGHNEEATIAIQWVSGIAGQLKKKDFAIFEKWLGRYINNWGKDDDFCLSVLSHFIVKYPEKKKIIKNWTRSKNKWKRRASATAFIQGGSWRIYDGYLKDVFEVAESLMFDKEDLVQKGAGWMLKIASQSHMEDVYNFVIEHKEIMPRTMLRYSIEKMPVKFKKIAMKKV